MNFVSREKLRPFYRRKSSKMKEISSNLNRIVIRFVTGDFFIVIFTLMRLSYYKVLLFRGWL